METMCFDDFKKWAAGNIKNHLPEEYKDAAVSMRSVKKLGSKHTGLSVRNEGQIIAAEINLDELYDLYLKGVKLDEIMDGMAKMALMRPPGDDGYMLMEDYEEVRKRLFIRLSHLKTNRSLLKTLPHRVTDDMALTYHVLSATNGRDMWSAMIDRALMESWNITEEQLHGDALNNSGIILPPRLEPVGDSDMAMLTNCFGIGGAAVLFYPGVLDMAAEKLGGDMYIIPSSVHEVFLLPAEQVSDVQRLARAVKEVNREKVSPRDLLSDNLYHYDTKRCRLEKALDPSGAEGPKM